MDTARSHRPAESTLREAVEAFVAAKLTRGKWGPGTRKRSLYDLQRFVGEFGDRPVTIVDVQFLDEFLLRLEDLELASRVTRWGTAATFCKWAWRHGYLAENPVAKYDPDDLPWKGKKAAQEMGRGKVQLAGRAEVDRYIAIAMRQPRADHRVAALLPLLPLLRNGEVCHLHVRDCDTEWLKLYIRSELTPGGWSVKTAASATWVPLDELLLRDIRALCRGRSGDAYLLQGYDAKHHNRPCAHAGDWLRKIVRKVCSIAGVTSVTPHGLRGTGSTILDESGEDVASVGRALRHGDRGQTARRHYIGAPAERPALRLVSSSSDAAGPRGSRDRSSGRLSLVEVVGIEPPGPHCGDCCIGVSTLEASCTPSPLLARTAAIYSPSASPSPRPQAASRSFSSKRSAKTAGPGRPRVC